MSAETIDLVDDLAERFTNLRPILNEHVSDNFGEVLPHLFFGDLTRYALNLLAQSRGDKGTEAHRELAALLEFLESSYRSGGEEVQDLIAVSFLEHLPRPDERGSEIRSLLGRKMARQLRKIG